jgi:bifunctional UDP-N-acetylglucosamine pyrophosphorylase/glucosamine-1-phosphate N-acetyltransferase
MTNLFFIFAAGKSSRMMASTSKVLFPLGGRRVIDYVIDASPVDHDHIYVTVSPEVERYVQSRYPNIHCVRQDDPKGTGSAFACLVHAAERRVSMCDVTITVALGDLPLIRKEDLQPLDRYRSDADVVVIGMTPPNPSWYGRLVTEGEHVKGIVESKNATPEEKEITLCNTGVMKIKGQCVHDFLSIMKKNHVTGEYYLTDLISHVRQAFYINAHWESFLGVNTKEELVHVEKLLQKRWRARAFKEGAFLTDPETVFLSFDTQFNKDVIVDPFVRFGPGVVLENNVFVGAFSALSDCTIGAFSTVGPHACVRSGTRTKEHVAIGSFVDVKQSTLGQHCQAKHLSYIGNATLGDNVNIGAGTVTCNYDGHCKHETLIESDTFVEANSSLIAPVTIGKKVTVGAGTVVGSNVPDHHLAVARCQQKNIPLSSNSKHLNRPQKKPKA